MWCWPSLLIIVSAFAINGQLADDTEVASAIKVNALQKFNCSLDDLRALASEQVNLVRDHESNAQIVRFILDVKNCTLPILTEQLFSTLELVNLTIFNSKVSIIGEGWLDGQEYLQSLQLIGNRIRELKPWTSESLDQLALLNLEKNEIWRIDGRAFENYPSLQWLNLAYNRIEMIADGVFKAVPHLKWLSLEGNLIKRIESFTFKPLLKLTELHLQNNRIDHVNPYSLTTTSRLEVLNLQGNRIRNIDILLYNLNKLDRLNLSNNLLEAKSLEENVFHQNNILKVLDLSFNQLNEFELGAFNGLGALEVGYTVIKYCVHVLTVFVQFQIFNASNNQLQHIQPITVTPLTSVKHFDISHNNLTYIMDNNLVYLVAAEHINISYNKIDNIQKWSFSDLKALKVLDLSHNRIFDDEFLTDLRGLTVLNVSYNRFDAFDPSNVQAIDEVNFQGNPLGCSWLLSQMANDEFGNIRLGHFLVSASVNHSEEHVRAPEEIKCLDYDSDDPLRVNSIERNIVVVRQIIKEPCVDRTTEEVSEVIEKQTLLKGNILFKKRVLF